MTPTARLDTPRRTSSGFAKSGLPGSGLQDPWWRSGSGGDSSGGGSEGTYELWHYHATNEAVKRILSETKVTLADKYAFVVPDYVESIAKKTVDVVRGEGGEAHLENRTFEEGELDRNHKVAVVESETNRETIEGFVDQVVKDAKLGDYGSDLSDAGLGIIFDEIRSSKSRPKTDLLLKNDSSPFRSYYIRRNDPCIQWKQVKESSGGQNEGQEGAFPVLEVQNQSQNGEARIVAQTVGSDALLGRMGKKITLGIVENGKPKGAAYFQVPDRLSATQRPTQGKTVVFVSATVPPPLVEAARSGTLVALPKKAEGAVRPSEVPTGGNGSGGPGGTGQPGGNRTWSGAGDRWRLAGVSRSSAVILGASALSATIILAAEA